MVEYYCALRKVRRLILPVFTLFLLPSCLTENAFGSVHYYASNEARAVITAPPVTLQAGTAGRSTIYVNNTGAGVDVAAQEIARPCAAGQYADWVSEYPLGTVHWDCCDDPQGSDDDRSYVEHRSYIKASEAYNIQKGRRSGTINWVRIYIKVKSVGILPNIAPSYVWTLIRTYNSDYEGNQINLRGVTTYADYYSEYVTNPFTGRAWTWDEIEDLQVGASGKSFAIPIFASPRMTTVWVVVNTTYDSVLRVVNHVAAEWEVNLKVYDSLNIDRLSSAKISFHDGASSDQITVNDGNITQSEGEPYHLADSQTIYVLISNVQANEGGISYLYVYLKIKVPSTSTYALYVIIFKIT